MGSRTADQARGVSLSLRGLSRSHALDDPELGALDALDLEALGLSHRGAIVGDRAAEQHAFEEADLPVVFPRGLVVVAADGVGVAGTIRADGWSLSAWAFSLGAHLSAASIAWRNALIPNAPSIRAASRQLIVPRRLMERTSRGDPLDPA